MEKRLCVRDDNPLTMEWTSDDDKEWFYHGKYIPVKNQEEFERYIKIAFLE